MATKKHAGFTLLELMIAIAILGILVSISMPSFSSLIARNLIEGLQSDFVEGINLARSEAVKRAAEVRFVPVDTSDWSKGWQVIADGNRDGDYVDAVEDAPLFVSQPAHISLTLSNGAGYNLPSGYLSFNAFGALSSPSDILAVSMADSSCRYAKTTTFRVNAVGGITKTEVACN